MDTPPKGPEEARFDPRNVKPLSPAQAEMQGYLNPLYKFGLIHMGKDGLVHTSEYLGQTALDEERGKTGEKVHNVIEE